MAKIIRNTAGMIGKTIVNVERVPFGQMCLKITFDDKSVVYVRDNSTYNKNGDYLTFKEPEKGST